MALPAQQTSLIKASGGDYTSLAAWETDLDSANLDMDYTGEVEGEITGNVAFSGVDGGDGSPDPYKVIIKAKAGFEANGTNESTCAKHSGLLSLEGSTAVRFEVLGIEISDGLYGVRFINSHVDTEHTIAKCVIRDTTTTAGLDITGVHTVDIPIRIGGNLLIDCGSGAFDAGIKLNDSSLTTKVEVFNNTIYHGSPVTNCPGIYEVGGTFGDFRNNAVCYYGNGGENTPIDYLGTPSNVTCCAGSGDSTIPAGTGNIDTLRDDGTDWTDTSTHDFSLVSSGVLVAAGQTVSASWFTSACATDMAGNSWAATPAIGCFEVAGGGGDALTATDITAGTPVIGTPAIGQTHTLTSAAITTAAPTLGTPTIGQQHSLTASEIATDTPDIEIPTIGQVHALTSGSITTGTPTPATPGIGQVHGLTATAITAQAPTVGTPTLAVGVIALTAVSIVTAPPVVAEATLGQIHALTASGVTTGNPALGPPTLDRAATPASRTYLVPAENREMTVQAENRCFIVPAENRTYTV